MQIKMKTLMAGPELTAQAGEIIDIDAEKALALIKGGFAEAVATIPQAASSTPTPTPPPEGEGISSGEETLTPETNLAPLNAKDMIALIEQQTDLAALQGIADNDARKTVIDAAKKRIEALQAPKAE